MLTVEKNMSLYQAVQKTQQRAQERQAAMAPQGAPATMPGLATPGMGQEQPTAGPAGPPNVQALLAQLSGPPAGASAQPGTPGAVLSLGRRM